ncbi:hypothetical protein BGX33_001476 [Mortierella sp. NVP41]|nr:hypothetical protein BGX33_001476 [Mortierella sp. NVP41]
MGILIFDCVTTDATATTFYEAWHRNVVLVKSNTNPSTLRDVNWLFVSSYTSKNLPINDGIPITAGCAVDSRGVVTFVAANYIFTQTDPYSKYISALRYDPAGVSTEPSFNQQGPGVWSNVTLDPAFGASSVERIWLYYSTVAGVETLNLAYLTRMASFEAAVVFGTFNTATATFSPTGRWSMPTLTYGGMRSITFSGNEMYYLARQYLGTMLTVFSLKNVGTNTPAQLRAYNTSLDCNASQGTRSALHQNNFYVICGTTSLGPLNSLATLKDATNPGSKFSPTQPITTPMNIKQVDFLLPIGSNTTTGASPFALMQRDDSYIGRNIQYSVTLTGPGLGSVYGGIDATIPEKFGLDPVTTTTRSFPYPTNGGSSGGGGNGGSTIVIVAGKLPVKFIVLIVIGALIVGGGILLLVCGCLGGCCLAIKQMATGEGKVDMVNVGPDGTISQVQKKDEEAGVGGGVDGGVVNTYPVITQPAPIQDNGLQYLFIDNNTTTQQQQQQEYPVLAPPVIGTPPSSTVPRHSRPDV